MAQYQGQNVTVMRDALASDAGFDASADQVIVQMADGSEKTVPRGEVSPPPARNPA